MSSEPATTSPVDDMGAVRHQLKKLVREERFEELVELVLELLVQVRDDNTALRSRLHNALRALYGRRSEKVTKEQLELAFDKLGDEVPQGARDALEEGEPPQETSNDPVEQPSTKPRPPARERKGRNALPEHLPRESQVARVADEDRVCTDCGAAKKTIGHTSSEILEFVPAHFKVIEEQREKVACPKCEAGVVIADSEKVRERGRPGPGLLAHLFVSKHADALPIYRQSQIYQRYGVHLAASTLGEWLAFAIAVARPLAWEIKRRVFASAYIFLDDTTLRVQDKKDPRGIRKGRLWCAAAWKAPYVAFIYKPNWSAKEAADFLRHYGGFVHGDGYGGYSAALGPPGNEPLVAHDKRLGCGMHIRRKFEAAADGGDVRGAIAL